jgi:hypothetical protein
MIGDISRGEYFQYYHGVGFNTNGLSWTANSTAVDLCAVNPLSDPSCPTYQQAFHAQQCSINPLYMSDCPGYFIAQCNLNPLYNESCPGYREAVVVRNLLQATQESTNVAATEPQSLAEGVSFDTLVNTTINTSPSPSSTSQSNTTTSTTSPTSVTSVTSVVAPQTSSPASPTNVVASKEVKTETKTDSKSENKNTTRTVSVQKTETKNDTDNVPTQVSILSTMAKAPEGFNAYSIVLADVPFYKPYEVYKNQKNVDNRRALRGLFGPNDEKYNQIVDSQYK